jgi:YcxB-like protein
LHEEIEYELSNETLKLTGETFNAEMRWDKAHKIQEVKDWFLIYQSTKTAILIPKINFSEEQIQQLRNIFKTHKTVKVRLK